MTWQATIGGHTDDASQEQQVLDVLRQAVRKLRDAGIAAGGSFTGASGTATLQDEPPAPGPFGPGTGGGGGREDGGG